MNKCTDITTAISHVHEGDTVMIGGFSHTGSPRHLIQALAKSGVKHLHTISDDLGITCRGYEQTTSILLKQGQIDKATCCFIAENPLAGQLYLEGKLDIEFFPMGTFVEKIRAGGAGIGGFYTKTGVGTLIEKGKEKRIINGETYLLELPLHANVALIKAYKADRYGNAVFKYTARNYNPIMATAADIVIVETEQLVEPGTIDPDAVHLPGIFVDYVVQAEEDIL